MEENQAPIPHFLMCIGSAYYTKDEFEAEAKQQGISRRLSQIPKRLVPGKSKVFCIFGAGRDSIPKLCREATCREPLPRKNIQPGIDVACAKCGALHTPKVHKHGLIDNYFVPDQLEVVLRCSDQQARIAVQGLAGIGVVNAKLVEDEATLKAELTLDSEGAREAASALASLTGVECDVDLMAHAIKGGAKVVFVSRELSRGCGQRKHHGAYAVSSQSPNQSPLQPIWPTINYISEHFRGLRELTEEESAALDAHVTSGPHIYELPFPKKIEPVPVSEPETEHAMPLVEAVA